MARGKTTRPWIYYGWIIVGTSFTAMAFHQTARFSFSIFQVPLIQEFGWGRGALGGAYALMLGSYAVFSPIMGNLFDKKGARAVMPWGSVLVGTGFTLAYFISELWHVYLVPCLFVGIGMALSGFAMHSALMPQWFQKKRGLATGLALSGSGTGILLFIPLIEWLITTYGWRQTYLIFGLAVLSIVVPLTALLLRRSPEDVGQHIDGEDEPTAHSPPKTGEKSPSPPLLEVFRQVCRQKNFWTLLIVVFFMGLNNNSILSQLQLYLVDAEYSTALAAFFFGMLGAIRMLATFSMGWLSDFIGRQRAQALSSFISCLRNRYSAVHPSYVVKNTDGMVLHIRVWNGPRRNERMLLLHVRRCVQRPLVRSHYRPARNFLRPRGVHRPPAGGFPVRLYGELHDSLRRDSFRPGVLHLHELVRL